MVVILVHRAVRYDLRSDVGLKSIHILFRRIPIKKKRAYACAEEMVGAAGAERAQFLRPTGARERESILVVREMRDNSAIRRHGSPQRWQNLRRDLFPVSKRRMFETAEERTV